MSCGGGRRCGSDLVLLWCRLAAVAPIQPLAWEPPYAAGAALEKAKRQERKKGRKERKKERKKALGSTMAPVSETLTPDGPEPQLCHQITVPQFLHL